MKIKTKFLTRSNTTLPMIDKTHQHKFDYDDDNDDDDTDFYGNVLNYSSPNRSKKSSIVASIEGSKSDEMIKMMGTPQMWNMGSLIAALPVSPTSSPTTTRASVEFYTPTYEDVRNSQFSNEMNKQRQNSKNLSISTLYESATGNEVGMINSGRNGQQKYINYSSNSFSDLIPADEYESSIVVDGSVHDVLYHALPPVPEEMSLLQRPGKNAISTNPAGFEMAKPVMVGEDNEDDYRTRRVVPYQQFLEEIQRHKWKAEVDAARKEKCTQLLRKLRVKEAAIDKWEAKERSKAESQLEKTERKLNKKRAQAVQKAHKKFENTQMKAEKWKTQARESVLKEMASVNPERRKSGRSGLSFGYILQTQYRS